MNWYPACAEQGIDMSLVIDMERLTGETRHDVEELLASAYERYCRPLGSPATRPIRQQKNPPSRCLAAVDGGVLSNTFKSVAFT